MKIKKVYISGKITGLPIDEAKTNFQHAENKLREKGYEVVNPFNTCVYECFKNKRINK